MTQYLIMALWAAFAVPAAASPSLLPRPTSAQWHAGSLKLDATTTIGIPRGDAGARRAAVALSGMLHQSTGIAPRIVEGSATITLSRAKAGPEAYNLDVDATGAKLSARDDAGLFYAAVTLWQLATPSGTIPAVSITDAPRFEWRGLMLDSARHFQSPAFIKRLLDWMALAKLNRFHWHLVDDQGWRIPIDKWPRLTEIGGWRTPASTAPAPALPKTGGVYTKAEIRDVVAYAAARHITVIPEIEMPGHALSAIRAYPQFGVGPVPPAGIESEWGVFPYLYNVDDKTFAFLEDVLTEVIDLFPGDYVHVGGDEATKTQWHDSPAVQAKMRSLGLANEEALQGWFIARIGKFLTAHQRKLIGWDEILAGGVPASATVMSWQGIDGAVKAAAAGHDSILAAAPTLYLDHIASTDEPIGRATVVSLADVYAFDPLPVSIPAAQRHHVLGLQGTLWTEHMRSEARVEHQAFPRALAIAELGWAPAEGRDYPDFARRAAVQMERLRAFSLIPFRHPRESGVSSPEFRKMGSRYRGIGGVSGAILTTCENKLVLGLEDDYPAAGPRATFRVDILAPCWRVTAPVEANAIEVDVGQLPFNYQIGKDRDAIKFRAPATPAGELEIRDGCDGERLAALPLATAAKNPGVTTLRTTLQPRARPVDLCLTFTARDPDPIWAVAAVRTRP